MTPSAYRAKTVTLASTGQEYTLAALLQAGDPNFPISGREVSIQVSSSTVGSIFIGEAGVTSTNCGMELKDTSAPRVYRSATGSIPLGMITLKPGANGIKINVEVIP